MGCGGSKKKDLENKRAFRKDEEDSDGDEYEPYEPSVPVSMNKPKVSSSGSQLSKSYTERQIEEREVFLKNIENQLIDVNPQKCEIWGNSEQVQMEYKQIRSFEESSQIFGLPRCHKIKTSEITPRLSQYGINRHDIRLIDEVIGKMKSGRLQFSDKCMRGLIINLFDE